MAGVLLMVCAGPLPAFGRSALRQPRWPVATRQRRSDRAPAAPGPGADAASDCDPPAQPDHPALADDRAAVGPIFDGANRRRDRRRANCRSHSRSRAFDRSPGCEPDRDPRSHPITLGHTCAVTHRPAARSPPHRPDPHLADVEQLRAGDAGDEPELLRQQASTQAEVGRGRCGPTKDDKNVSPEEMAAYARAPGLAGPGPGERRSPRRCVGCWPPGVPVLIETWHEPKPNDGMGHYRLLVGFDDAARRVDRLRLVRLARAW